MLRHWPVSRPLAVDGPGDIKPNYSYFPFTQTIADIAGGIQANVIIILGILFIIGVVAVVAAKSAGSQKMQSVGWGVVVGDVVAMMLVGSVWAIVTWGSNQQIM
jgi:hypothetical protein